MYFLCTGLFRQNICDNEFIIGFGLFMGFVKYRVSPHIYFYICRYSLSSRRFIISIHSENAKTLPPVDFCSWRIKLLNQVFVCKLLAIGYRTLSTSPHMNVFFGQGQEETFIKGRGWPKKRRRGKPCLRKQACPSPSSQVVSLCFIVTGWMDGWMCLSSLLYSSFHSCVSLHHSL